ncbi:mobile mystery protein A [Flavobacterium filum]|uniref:mobile mystery protein A n=1 Tax=Flavobacterium filum TaxID=370974 RepID=UPI000403D947|nr:mobile mystery protein A [Flavobacterium filum]
MRNQKKLLIEQLDRKIKSFQKAENVIIPEKGWIYSIRTALNMTLEQLGERLNITKQGVKKIEEREANESISIHLLKETANALDMKFVYGFVPKKGSLEKLIEYKSEELARKIVLRTNHNMQLENQGNSEEQIQKAITDLASDIKREMRRSLWD